MKTKNIVMMFLFALEFVFLPMVIFAGNVGNPIAVKTDQSGVEGGAVVIYASYTGNQSGASAIEGITANTQVVGGIGVFGQTFSETGMGVKGYAVLGTGKNFGVFGGTPSTSGVGVQGQASATSGITYGVVGSNSSTSGTGVQGQATATSGDTYGVKGTTSSNTGSGVSGQAASLTGITCGVSGISMSTSGVGVLGNAKASSGQTYGVQGMASSTTGVGVLGKGAATTGANYGVVGESASTSGIGVYGNASATSGKTYGIYGISSSKDGYGVYGKNKSSGGYAIMSDGAMCVNGPLVVNGDLLVPPGQAIPQLSNLALKDNTLEASSVLYESLNKLKDGIIDRDMEGEWSGTFDSSGYSWVKCTWCNSIGLNIIVIYPSASNMKNIYATCEIEHADGTKNTILAGYLPYGGAAKKIPLKEVEGKCVKSLKITLKGEPNNNFRLSEIECYYDPSLKL